MAPALILALALMASAPTADEGEPLPSGAPTDPYQLTAFCYGAVGEYLQIYDRVKPDLLDIDRKFGPATGETEPYAQDVAAARTELKVMGEAVEAAEKASPRAIAPQGAAALKAGRAIWAQAENKSSRELARAWMSWGIPDRCPQVAHALRDRSRLLGQALSYNNRPPPTPDEGLAMPAPPPAEDPSYHIQPIAPVETLTPGATPPPAAAQEATVSGDGPTATAPASMADGPAEPPPEAAAPALAPSPTTVAEAAPTGPPKVLEAPSPAAPQPEVSSPTATAPAAPPRPTAIPDADEPMEPVL